MLRLVNKQVVNSFNFFNSGQQDSLELIFAVIQIAFLWSLNPLRNVLFVKHPNTKP